jgi:hypothetical protein
MAHSGDGFMAESNPEMGTRNIYPRGSQGCFAWQPESVSGAHATVARGFLVFVHFGIGASQ